jgi:UDP-galactopyranose mutase
MKINIIGCGLSGIVCAIKLKEQGHNIEIFENRSHIGGNCYDEKIKNTLVHLYGPHIFHTDDEEVYLLLSRYTEWIPFQLKPKGNTKLGLLSLPYSKKTIKEIGRELSEDEILKYIFVGYSEKQWGVKFNQIPTEIINRIPKVAKHEDPTWFEGQKYQCIPKYGYTNMMTNMLDGIKYNLCVDNNEWKNVKCDLLVYTGKIDEYFNLQYGRLPYRSLNFKHKQNKEKMNTFIINQNIKNIPYTRVYDHSYFTYNHSGSTIITEEYPIEHDNNNIPFYPIPFGSGKEIYQKYANLAKDEKNVIFTGRLATYKYLDMWQAIRHSIDITNLN